MHRQADLDEKFTHEARLNLPERKIIPYLFGINNNFSIGTLVTCTVSQ